MVFGKSGKTDPAKASTKKKSSNSIRTVFKMSQMREIIRTSTRLRISSAAAKAAIFGIDYLLQEIAEGSHNAAVGDQKKKVQPKHVNACIAMDVELRHVGSKWLIKSGGATGYLKSDETAPAKKNKTA